MEYIETLKILVHPYFRLMADPAVHSNRSGRKKRLSVSQKISRCEKRLSDAQKKYMAAICEAAEKGHALSIVHLPDEHFNILKEFNVGDEKWLASVKDAHDSLLAYAAEKLGKKLVVLGPRDAHTLYVDEPNFAGTVPKTKFFLEKEGFAVTPKTKVEVFGKVRSLFGGCVNTVVKRFRENHYKTRTVRKWCP